jgi:AcrR family transcriptional regulator
VNHSRPATGPADKSSRPGAPRRPRDAAATRADLLRAARRRFARDGYDRASVRDIAADAGVNIALISRYFGSKDALFAEALADAGWFREVRAVPPDELPARMLARILDQPPAYGRENPMAALLRSSGHAGVAERMRAHLDENYTRRLSGLSSEEDATVRADLFVALVLGIGVLHTVIRKPPLASQRFEQLWPHVERMFNVLFPQTDGGPPPNQDLPNPRAP